MIATATAARWSIDDAGAWVSFRCNDARQARAAAETVQTGKVYDVEVKQHRDKRSKNANDLLWEMCTQLAAALSKAGKVTALEVYRDHIKAIGIAKDFTLTQDEAKTLRYLWEQQGSGWITEQLDYAPDGDSVKVRCYYGSSTYNTRQMSRLIDSVMQDCAAVGIDTRPPEEIALLKQEWQGAKV